MIMPVEKIPAPRTLEDRRRSREAWRTAEKASVSLLTEKSRSLYALVRRRWLPAVGRFCANALDVTLEKLFTSKEYTYKKGEGYPRVRILRNGVIIVPIEELYGSTKVRENVEAMRKRMQAMIEENGMVEVKRPGSTVSKVTSAQKAPAAKKRKRAAPDNRSIERRSGNMKSACVRTRPT